MAIPMNHGFPPPADTVGGRIAQARSYTRLSQNRMREALGVDRKTLSSWENNRTSPSVQQLLIVARVTGFPATWFVDGLDERPRQDSNLRPSEHKRHRITTRLTPIEPLVA